MASAHAGAICISRPAHSTKLQLNSALAGLIHAARPLRYASEDQESTPQKEPDVNTPTTFKTSITATLSVRNWPRAIEFYKAAFGATETYRVPSGGVGRLSIAGAEFWVAEESPEHLNFSPETIGGCSVRMLLIVDNPAATCAQAVAAGASQVVPVAEAHGWRVGRILDPFGHHWEVGKPLH